MTTLLDSKHQLLELALTACRTRLSSRSGWVHFCYEDPDAVDTIPYYENLCYSLALFRTCVGDQVQEAKERLDHLLSFDTFPTYLHEYPKTGTTQRCYFPLYWISKLFSGVIEKPLRVRLEAALAKIQPFKKPEGILSSRDAASLCLHLQLEGKSLHALAPYWEENLQIYTGPLLEEKQYKNTLEVTLFDFFMAAATGRFSPRLLKPHPVHMHAALIFPTEALEPKGCITIPSYDPASGERSKGFHLFRHVWEGSEGHLHSFVCQEKHHHFDPYIFTYPEEIPDERQGVELAFFVDYHPDVTLLVNGEKSTVFQLGDQVTIQTPKKTVPLTFKVLEGEGIFMGHISRGNRPAQVCTQGFTSYDWKISIRTLRRSSKLKLALLVE